MTDDILARGKQRAEALNLHFIEGEYTRDQWGSVPRYRYYSAEGIHRLLGEGVEVLEDGDMGSRWLSDPYVRGLRKALLVGIHQIVQESEERKLLREMLEMYEEHDGNQTTKLYMKVKALLERSDD